MAAGLGSMGLPSASPMPSQASTARRASDLAKANARHGDGAFLAEELPRDRGAFGSGDEALDGRIDCADALVERQGDQFLGR